MWEVPDMGLLAELGAIHEDSPGAFLVGAEGDLHFRDVLAEKDVDLSQVRSGDVVALIGDFVARDIATLLRLFDRLCVVVPLTDDTRADHSYFYESALVDWVIEDASVRRLRPERREHALLNELRERGHPGLVLFSSGTTGRPKAILHDFATFVVRFRTPRPALRTLNFLLFDHIGGINTLLHTLFNKGVVVAPSGRTPEAVLCDIRDFDVEVLPTTPSFLRMVLLSGLLEKAVPPSLRLITYGTERMDESTLETLCRLLSNVEFRQTFGMSELGILRVKSKASDSLWMILGGEGVAIRVVEGRLQILSENRMLGYLNAPSPFLEGGWYDTGDLVEQDDVFIKVVGRATEVINVGGIKVLPSEIERVALEHPDVLRAHAIGVNNPITGQHIEVTVQPRPEATLDRPAMRRHFEQQLSEHLRPHRIKIGEVRVNHRFKREG